MTNMTNIALKISRSLRVNICQGLVDWRGMHVAQMNLRELLYFPDMRMIALRIS